MLTHNFSVSNIAKKLRHFIRLYKIYAGTPKITITDKDTGRTYQAENVRNYSHTGYGNFETIITYYPGSVPLVIGHEYEVKITGLTSYTFKLFQLQNKSIE